MSEFRALGTVVSFPTATDIALSLVLTGTGSATLNSSDTAYLQIPAGSVFRFPDLLQYIEQKIADWIYAACVADTGVTTPSAATDLAVSITFSPSLTQNASLCTLTIGSNLGGAQVGGTNAAITGATLNNTNGLWSKLGLVQEDTTSQAMSVAAGVATRVGVFQPRSIFVFERSEVDDGDAVEAQLSKSFRLGDGSGSAFYAGRQVQRRRFRLVDLDEKFCGRARAIARLGTSGASSVTLDVDGAVETTYSTGITGAQYDSTLASEAATDGAYVNVGGAWVGRVRAVASTGLTLYEKVPSSTTPPSRCAITRISEVEALWFEALRTGYLCVFDMVETLGGSFGTIRWTGQEYMLDDDSKGFTPERRDIANALYSYTFHLKRRDASGLTTVL